MFSTFSGETKAAAVRHLRVWTRLCGLTSRANRPNVEMLVCQAYQAAGLNPPRIVWSPSPLVAKWVSVVSMAASPEPAGRGADYLVFGAPTRKMWPPILRTMPRSFRREMMEFLQDGIYDANHARDLAFCEAMQVGQDFGNLADSVKAAIFSTLEEADISGVDRTLFSRIEDGPDYSVLGPQSKWTITLSFMRRRLGLVAATQSVAPLIDALTETHFLIPYENVCWLAEHPVLVAEDRVEYSDGWTFPISPELREWAFDVAARRAMGCGNRMSPEFDTTTLQ